MVVIIGAGMSGLAAAYYGLANLQKVPQLANKGIRIIERLNRSGGWIHSEKPSSDALSNIFLEFGPHSIRATGPTASNTLELIDELGIGQSVVPGRAKAQKRLIFSRGEIHELPNSIGSLFKKSALLEDKMPIMCLYRDLFVKSSSKSDESIFDFIARRFSSEVARRLICPMICGIFAGDARDISMKSFNKTLFDLEKDYGSVIRGIILKSFTSSNKLPPRESTARIALEERWSMYTFDGGVGTLPLKLAENIKENGVNIDLNRKIEEISFENGAAQYTVNGEQKNCSFIVSSVSAKETANLVENQHPKLAAMLREIPYVTVVLAHFILPKDVLDTEAFGVLVDPAEKLPILGILFDHCIYPHNKTVLTVMMGGKWFKDHFPRGIENEPVLDIARDGLDRILNVRQEPLSSGVYQLTDCIPQYLVGHNDLVEGIEEYCRVQKLPLALCGSSYHGVGINDVILSGKIAADHLTRMLQIG